MKEPRDTPRRELGDLLRRLRLRARLSLEDASRRVNIFPEVLTAFEEGHSAVSEYVVSDLLNAYHARQFAPAATTLMREINSKPPTTERLSTRNLARSVSPERNGIFISYRRSDESEFARRLGKELQDRFGRDRVFIDIDSIEVGLDFTEELDKALVRCAVLLVVMGPRWALDKDESGNSRIHDPHDWVRLEVERALLMPYIRVVPVLVDGTSMPKGSELPESLWDLRLRNAFLATNERLGDDVDALVPSIERILDSGPDLPSARPTAERVESRRLHIVCSRVAERSHLYQIHDALRSGGFRWPVFQWVGGYLVRDSIGNSPTIGDAQVRVTDWFLVVIDKSWETPAAEPMLGQLWKAANIGCIIWPLLVDFMDMPSLRAGDKSIRHLGGTSLSIFGAENPLEKLAARLMDLISNYDAANS